MSEHSTTHVPRSPDPPVGTIRTRFHKSRRFTELALVSRHARTAGEEAIPIRLRSARVETTTSETE